MEKPIQLKQNLAYSGWQISEKTAKESIEVYGLEFKDILKALSMGMKYYDPKYDNYVKILKHPDRQGYIYIAYKENTIWHASYYNNVPFNRLEKININMR